MAQRRRNKDLRKYLGTVMRDYATGLDGVCVRVCNDLDGNDLVTLAYMDEEGNAKEILVGLGRCELVDLVEPNEET